MKKKGNISIKAKLLGIIIPVVIAIILILVFTAISCIIRNYRELFQKFTGIFGKQSGIKN